MKNQLVLLPPEVAQIAEKVSVEKRCKLNFFLNEFLKTQTP